MKQMYKKPMSEVMDLKSTKLMDQVVTSRGQVTDPTLPPPVQIPKRGEVIG